MAVTIIEALENANYNLDNLKSVPGLLPLVKEQLNNALTLLEKGYSINDEVEPLLEQYGNVEKVPAKEIKISDINQINTDTEEGKLLIAELAKITTESQKDKTPPEVLEQLNELKKKCSF